MSLKGTSGGTEELRRVQCRGMGAGDRWSRESTVGTTYFVRTLLESLGTRVGRGRLKVACWPFNLDWQLGSRRLTTQDLIDHSIAGRFLHRQLQVLAMPKN